jgi:hypothetical protein
VNASRSLAIDIPTVSHTVRVRAPDGAANFLGEREFGSGSISMWDGVVALVVLFAVSGLPSAGMAASFAASSGTMVVGTSTNRFLPSTATGDACLTAQTENISAPGTNYVGTFGAPVGCMNDFFVKSARQPSIFYTYYDFKRYRGFEGATGAAKFPAPAMGNASLAVLDGPVGDDTLAVANGSFSSSQSGIGGVVLFRSASLQSDATVTRRGANSPQGIATSRTYDPWFFFPEFDTELTLQVTLADVFVDATSDPGEASASIFQAFGAFGRGSIPGVDTLATWEEDIFLGATGNSSLRLSERTIFGNSGDPFRLLANQTYWLTAATQAGAAAAPEPASLALFGFGILSLVLILRSRSKDPTMSLRD